MADFDSKSPKQIRTAWGKLLNFAAVKAAGYHCLLRFLPFQQDQFILLRWRKPRESALDTKHMDSFAVRLRRIQAVGFDVASLLSYDIEDCHTGTIPAPRIAGYNKTALGGVQAIPGVPWI